MSNVRVEVHYPKLSENSYRKLDSLLDVFAAENPGKYLVVFEDAYREKDFRVIGPCADPDIFKPILEGQIVESKMGRRITEIDDEIESLHNEIRDLEREKRDLFRTKI